MASRCVLVSPPHGLSCMWRRWDGITWFVHHVFTLLVPPRPKVPLRLHSNQHFCLQRWPIHLLHRNPWPGNWHDPPGPGFHHVRQVRCWPSQVLSLCSDQSSSTGLCDTDFPEGSNSEVSVSWVVGKNRISMATNFHFLKSSLNLHRES